MTKPVRTILFATPSFDVYGADLQLLESVRAVTRAQLRAVVVAPSDGPLAGQLIEAGAEIETLDFPVLRRRDKSWTGVLGLARRAAAAAPGMRRLVQRCEADVVYVNTVTLPWWIAVARTTRAQVACHVHEAEPRESVAVARAMNAPLLLAHSVAVNSQIALDSLCRAVPALKDRARLVYNGVPAPPDVIAPAAFGSPTRLVSVGRLSRRKGGDVALAATALLRRRGYDVHLELCGSPAPDAVSFANELHRRAAEPDLDGAVTFSGYSSPVWPALARADLFVAPARAEPFGNAVVEAQLAERCVVASAVEGHLETITHGGTGIHVPAEDPEALADAIAALVADPAQAKRIALRGRLQAAERFGVERYHRQIVDLLTASTPRAQAR